MPHFYMGAMDQTQVLMTEQEAPYQISYLPST